MPAVLVGKEELLKLLKRTAKEHGLHCTPVDQEGLRAELEVTLARWFFGGRKVTYHLGCRLDEATHAVRFREMVKEETWGIPAPFFIAEKTTMVGGQVSGTRLDADAAAGPLEYHRLREAVEHVARHAGWRYYFEAGKP